MTLSHIFPPKRVVEERFISLLQNTVRSLKHIKLIHCLIITNGFEQNEYIAPKFISACAGLKKMLYAQRVFYRVFEPNVLLWNAMFKGYADNEFYRQTLVLFNQMNTKYVRPNCFTFPVVLKSCTKCSALSEGKEVHCIVVKIGFSDNHFIGTNLVDMYSSGGEVESAYRVFVEMTVKNIVAWTTIISAYISYGDIESARGLFDKTCERDVILWNIMISGYIGKGDMGMARKLFDEMNVRDVMSWNTIMTGYFNNDDLEEGERFFEEIPQKNVFSWNGLIAGYASKGRFFQVLEAFKRMLAESSVCPSDATLVYALSACSRLGALGLGKWIHTYAESNGLKENVFIGNALIDMYSRGGSIDTAVAVFNGMGLKDLITWNSMIGGLATHGRGTDALYIFEQMRNNGETPDRITFIGVLSACSHMGLIDVGLSYFNSMTKDYSIVPEIEHYGCMVDLLARSGQLNEAVYFIRKMPIEADDVIWSTLLGACKTYGNVQLAELALEWLIKLEPKDPANYVMLSNIYGDTKRWADLARLKLVMRGTGIKKPPGCSLIEVDDSVTEFFSSDKRHPASANIYQVLNGLRVLLKSSWCGPELEELVEGN